MVGGNRVGPWGNARPSASCWKTLPYTAAIFELSLSTVHKMSQCLIFTGAVSWDEALGWKGHNNGQYTQSYFKDGVHCKSSVCLLPTTSKRWTDQIWLPCKPSIMIPEESYQCCSCDFIISTWWLPFCPYTLQFDINLRTVASPPPPFPPLPPSQLCTVSAHYRADRCRLCGKLLSAA